MNAKGLFVTVLYGNLARETGEFIYARGRAEPPYCGTTRDGSPGNPGSGSGFRTAPQTGHLS